MGRSAELRRIQQSLDDPSLSVVIVEGNHGVGKSSVLRESNEKARRRKLPVLALKRASSVPLPYGVLTPLLKAGEAHPVTFDQAFSLAQKVCHETLIRHSSQAARPIAFLDDLHRIDVESSGLLRKLTELGLLILVSTRNNPSWPDPHWPVDDEQTATVSLRDFPAQQSIHLLSTVLGSPPEDRTARMFHESSQGNPHILRGLVEGSLASGALILDRAQWQLRGPITASGPLSDGIGERMLRYDSSQRTVINTLACCGALALGDLEELASLEKIAELERHGVVEPAGGPLPMLALRYPAHAAHLNHTMPLSVRRSILRRQADKLARHSPRGEESPAVTLWRLESGEELDSQSLLAAASAAGEEPETALRILEHSPKNSFHVSLQRAGALHRLGCWDAAELEVRTAVGLANTPEQIVDASLLHMQNQFWGYFDTNGLAEVYRFARNRLGRRSSGFRRLHTSYIAYCSYWTGSTASFKQLQLSGHQQAALVAAWQGRTAVAWRELERSSGAHGSPRPWVFPYDPDHTLLRDTVLATSGRLSCAVPLETEELSESTWFLARSLRCCTQGQFELMAGHLEHALAWFQAALKQQEGIDSAAVGSASYAGAAAATAQLGNYAAAETYLLMAQQAIRDRAPFCGVEVERDLFQLGQPLRAIAQAWITAGWDGSAASHKHLRRAARWAAHRGMAVQESWVLIEAVRLGDPQAAGRRLRQLANQCDNGLIAGRAAAAAALAKQDPGQLVEAARLCATAGLDLQVSDCATAAVRLWTAAGHPRKAAMAQSLLETVADRVGHVETPEVHLAKRALTRRENEVATLASQGMSSRCIADRLFLSTRTVENHLQHIYAKLAIKNRMELRATLIRRDRFSPP
ncbi:MULTISPECIES: LuxR family transcriptional regulator [Streptomyces]|uniref:helix-turn-helix transcriptional regulator n=1 Tax=Streptomyces TaxID=1883 RepID=UPI00200E6381|nr:LuxR family transcriptional regulator [Streptomyces virginiae]